MTEVIIQIEDELCTDEVVQFANEAKRCVEFYTKENHDYGNSFDKGVDEIGIGYGVARIYGKMNRLITLTKKEAHVKDDNIDDILRDIACYSMMMLAYRKRQIEKEHSKIDFE